MIQNILMIYLWFMFGSATYQLYEVIINYLYPQNPVKTKFTQHKKK